MVGGRFGWHAQVDGAVPGGPKKQPLIEGDSSEVKLLLDYRSQCGSALVDMAPP